MSLVSIAAIAVLIAGCCPAPAPALEAPVVTQIVEKEGEAVVVTVMIDHEAAMATMRPEPTVVSAAAAAAAPSPADADDSLTLPYRPNRLIIKNADLSLLVDDTDNAIDRTAQIAADSGGYILSSRVWYQEWLGENYKYATITLGVPSDQFEAAMRRLRGLAVRVIDETASGQDVTDEYVDLQSRLENLTATRDRIRTFLDQATTVEEALEINKELKAVEEEIEMVQGRMNYLFDRAAYSTITVQIQPELPQATPTPTPTATPTPTPTPPWDPSGTAERAGNTLSAILHVLIEIAIWLGIVVAPLVVPPLIIAAFIYWIARRWMKRIANKKDQQQTNP
jgi:hypothetical protein